MSRYAWIGKRNDPGYYLALEEACLRESKSDFLLLWISDPAVFVGKNQNVWAQVSAAEAFRSKIPVYRRLSGGGTVYHDHGNLNFSLISNGEAKIAFRDHLEEILPYFDARGIEATIRNKSDLFCDGKKVSGNAEYFTGSRVLHHGTLLFDADLGQMRRLLTPNKNGYRDRSIDSNRNETTNLKGKLPDLENTYSLSCDIVQTLAKENHPVLPVENLPENLEIKAQKYCDKFTSLEWIYGRSPNYHFERIRTFGSSRIETRITVKEGRIEAIDLAVKPIEKLWNEDLDKSTKGLTGCYHCPKEIHKIVSSLEPRQGFIPFLRQHWLEILF